MVRIVIYLQLLKSHRNRRNSLVLDEGNTLFFIFGKILIIILIIISISYYFLLVTFLFLSFRVLGCLRNLKFMIDLHGLFVFLNMNYQKLGVDYY